jgi:hypothetical protein
VAEQSVFEGLAATTEMSAAILKIGGLLNWTQENLPGAVPTLVAETAYIAAERTVAGSPISLKAIISTIGCSEAGLRKPLQRLLDGGWVFVERDRDDHRVRRVVATDKLLGALVGLADRITEREAQDESV